MIEGSKTIGFVIIIVLYGVIGVLSVVGSIAITRRLLTPKAEQIFYGLFLIPIAAFYLAFVAYFGIETAWRMERSAVILFCALGVIGTRIPIALIAGYALHGVWDGLHELYRHAGLSIFEPGQATPLPLAYGVFCATYDVGMAAYFYTQRIAWRTAWRTATG